MDNKTATEKLSELEFRINSLEKEKEFDINQLTKEKVLPLMKQIEQINANIDSVMFNKYKDILHELHQEKIQVKAVVDGFKIDEANDLWYPNGTIVYLWQHPNRFSSDKQHKITNIKGIVQIYDGTQDLGSIPRWKFPKKGDIIVRYLKKNGSVGLRFEVISEYGVVKNWISLWCAEGDDPTNTPITRKDEKERQEELEKERQEELEKENIVQQKVRQSVEDKYYRGL
jgi:hypothetical protein